MPVPLPILLYHSVDDDPPSWIAPFTVGTRAFREQLDRIVEAAAAAGKALGVLVRRVEDAKQYWDRGFRFIGIGSDSATLFDGSLSTVDAARSVLSDK